MAALDAIEAREPSLHHDTEPASAGELFVHAEEEERERTIEARKTGNRSQKHFKAGGKGGDARVLSLNPPPRESPLS